MPTSSQAMILKSEYVEGNASNSRKSHLHVPTGDRPESRADLHAFNGSKERNCDHKKMEKVFQEKGLHPQLLFHPVTGCFAYRFKFSEESVHMIRPKSRADREVQLDTRSKSANVTKSSEKGRARLGEHVTIPENILSLGFRRPSKKNMKRETKSAHLFSDTHKQPSETQPDSKINKVSKKQTTASKAKDRKQERDEHRTSPRYETLLLPAVYLRKEPAAKEPLTVCFSLRDNESTTHRDLKNLIEGQGEVTITQLQYEPLSVRSGDPSINGRWLATMKDAFEVDSMLRKGFYMDYDHIIVKTLDDVSEREYRKYKFLQGMDSERDRLNLPTSKSSKKFHKIKPVMQKLKVGL